MSQSRRQPTCWGWRWRSWTTEGSLCHCGWRRGWSENAAVAVPLSSASFGPPCENYKQLKWLPCEHVYSSSSQQCSYHHSSISICGCDCVCGYVFSQFIPFERALVFRSCSPRANTIQFQLITCMLLFRSCTWKGYSCSDPKHYKHTVSL